MLAFSSLKVYNDMVCKYVYDYCFAVELYVEFWRTVLLFGSRFAGNTAVFLK